MDFLNFVLALHDRLGIDIPEADYPRLYSLDSALSYLASKPIANPTSNSAKESTKPGSSAEIDVPRCSPRIRHLLTATRRYQARRDVPFDLN